jgi:phosphoglycolate phosphatase-like HAD superfamily hydrolase
MIKMIIFDWDDVITLGSKEGYFKCYHETLVELGVTLSAEEEKMRILAKWGKTHQEELKELLLDKPWLFDAACEIYEKKLFGDTFVSSLILVKGTLELLQRLSKSYTLCIATGLNPRILKERIMPKFNIPPIFSQIISSYEIMDTDKQKPYPFMVNELLLKQKIKPAEAIVVGDAKGDVMMARAAGVTSVVVLTGNLNQKEAEDLKVNYIIKDVVGLEDVMRKMN